MDSQWLAVKKGRADTQENQGKRLFPLLVGVAHCGCFQCPVEAFDEPVGWKMVGGRPGQLSSTQFSQGVKEMRLELTSLVPGRW
jgi:hypothetical protein